MGALLFKHRLAVMLGAFGAGLMSATLARRGDAATLTWWDQPLWRWFDDAPHAALAVTGAFCVLAFLLRVTAEARLGAAVYGQGKTDGLVRGGPYRFLRNPLYAATWLFFAAATALWAPAPAWVVLSLLFFLALDAMVRHEETFLAESIGDSYRAYLKSTHRWLPVPGPRGDDVRPPARAYAYAAVGNLFFLSLGLFRVGVAAGWDAQVLGALNATCLFVWLGVLVVRRIRASRAK